MKPSADHDRHSILIYIRLLVLMVVGVGILCLLLLGYRSSQHEKTAQTSLQYHMTSLYHLQVIQREVLRIESSLLAHMTKRGDVKGSQELLPGDRNYSQVQYLIRQNHDMLAVIQAQYKQAEFVSLMEQIGLLLANLYTGELNELDTDDEIEGFMPVINGVLLKLEQLERLHQIANGQLIDKGRTDDKKENQILFGVLSFLVLSGALIFQRVFTTIKLILQKQKDTELNLFQEKEWSHTTLRSIGDAVITTDEVGKVYYMNPVAETLTRWSLSEARGQAFSKVFNVINEETGAPAIEIVRRVIRDGGTVGLANHSVLVSRDGKKRAIEDSAAPIRRENGDIAGVVVVFHDVTHSRKMAQEMSWQAMHDALTGLANRHKFKSALVKLIESSVEAYELHAFLYLDLDQFKLVNDTCGHVAGDELLKQVSGLLKSEVRDVDTVARLGGDEFGVLLASCPIKKAMEIAEDIRKAIQAYRFIWEKKVFSIGVSIGLVPIDISMSNVSDIMRAADMACYMAKDVGRNRVHVYQPGDQEITLRQGEMEWVSRIHHALDDDRFTLYCQDIVPFFPDSGQGKCFEILIRMQGEDGSVIGPMSFISAAERYNLMPAIDRVVVHKAFKQLSQGVHRGIDFFSINLSGQTLGDDDFLEFVEEQFRLFALPPHKLCFEITETAAITNFPQAMNFINHLQAKGCRFALDDFGSGLSSFGYLKNLPVDYLKIDGTFVRDMLMDPIDEAMIESINSIGHKMKIKTIAEFVENDEIVRKLRDIGVDYGQGYGLSRPVPLALGS